MLDRHGCYYNGSDKVLKDHAETDEERLDSTIQMALLQEEPPSNDNDNNNNSVKAEEEESTIASNLASIDH
jgi:hypothetical protein